jgi:type IV secretory pathway VirB2 component (pilin)
MKVLRWALVAVVIALGLALIAGKDDLRRYQRMRRM